MLVAITVFLPQTLFPGILPKPSEMLCMLIGMFLELDVDAVAIKAMVKENPSKLFGFELKETEVIDPENL